MVYPGLPVESTSRSSLDIPGVKIPIYQPPSSTPSVVLPQQQLVYTFYDTICGHPQTPSFPDVRRQPVTNSYNLRAQDYRGLKSVKWHQKSRPRFKEYPQMALHQPLPFSSPVVLCDPSHMAAPLPSLNPLYLPTQSFNQPFPTDTFPAFTPPVLPQTYCKPSAPQPFCLIHDIPTQSQVPHQGTPYYPIPPAYPKTRLYGSSSDGFPTTLASTSHGQSTTNFSDYPNEKLIPTTSTIKTELLYPERNSLTCNNQANLNESIFEMAEDPKLSASPTPTKPPKLDKYFTDSSTFDFTIEAEKMVSALCSTSLDLERPPPPTIAPPAAPEVAPPTYSSWYLDDFPKATKTIETQTSHPEDLQSPEVLRRAIYTGCTEMEQLLTTSPSTYRRNWLLSLCSATKIALSKSSTCFPIYLNDKAFGQDLMNSFLRISNGWLALDNYLNKQPNLSLSQKFDKDLQKSFKAWEASTSALLDHITRNFKKLDASTEDPYQENLLHTSSFPGDVALYVNYNLFSHNPGPATTSQVLKTNRSVYPTLQKTDQKARWVSVARESKVRTKWTITENRQAKDSFPGQGAMAPQPDTSGIDTMSIWSPSAPSNLLYQNRSPSNLTLVSQIETKNVKNNVEGETINLSAWFASMRRDDSRPESVWGSSKTAMNLRELPKSGIDVVGTSKMDANRQLRTLKNMRMIQSAPWTASQMLEEQVNEKKPSDDPAQDTKVYMKPGSYNVPKKKGQSKRSRKIETASTKTCSQVELGPKLASNFLEYGREDEEHPGTDIKEHSNSSSSSSSCSQDARKDVTWKAACASAELLLDALNVKKKSKAYEKEDEHFESSYEVSEEDEEDGFKALADETGKEGSQRTNVKTDSWLIKTLNNAGKAGDGVSKGDAKQVESEEGREVKDSWGEPEEKSFSVETSHTVAVMTLVDAVGKATYSETVRRFSTTTKPSSSKTSSQKCLGHTDAPREAPICSIMETDTEDKEGKLDSGGKQKKGKGQVSDKGWSVWYSSRRKQQSNSLEPATLDKLLTIYRVLWRMDTTKLFKFPGESSKEAESASNVTIESYRKIVKSPMFLETIGYKLKNHLYRKVEHVIKDFRKIVHNSKAYHQNDKDCTEKIETLSKKLEELLDQNFSEDLQPKANAQVGPASASGSPSEEKDVSGSRRNVRNI